MRRSSRDVSSWRILPRENCRASTRKTAVDRRAQACLRSGMRVRLVLALALLGCADRTAAPKVDYTEEAERICESLCAIDYQCVETPLMTYEECVEVCVGVDVFYEDSECGEAFRAFYGCIGSIESCEVWETANEEYCGEEFDRKYGLNCFAQEQGE